VQRHDRRLQRHRSLELCRAASVLGCQGWFTARVNTCGELDNALETAGQANVAAYIEVVTDAHEAPPMYKKLHENVESFYNM
jgi:indolepyruvate decarboxylase